MPAGSMGATLLVCVSRTNTVVAVRLWKKNPNTLAAATRADSSGDSASYSIWSGSSGPAQHQV